MFWIFGFLNTFPLLFPINFLLSNVPAASRSGFFVSYFGFPTIFREASLGLLLCVMMLVPPVFLLTCSLAAGAVAPSPVQKTFEVEAAVWVDLAEAAHHHVLGDLVTSGLVTRAPLILGPAQPPLGRVAVTRVRQMRWEEATISKQDFTCDVCIESNQQLNGADPLWAHMCYLRD